MARKKINGDDILKKITTLLIDESPKHPFYMRNYMKYNYRREKLDPPIKRQLEKQAENLFKDFAEAIKIKKQP